MTHLLTIDPNLLGHPSTRSFIQPPGVFQNNRLRHLRHGHVLESFVDRKQNQVLHHRPFDRKSQVLSPGFTIITWNNPKKLEIWFNKVWHLGWNCTKWKRSLMRRQITSSLHRRPELVEEIKIQQSEKCTLPETDIAHENPIFPGKYHQNGGFSMAMLVSGRVADSRA